ncbi:hypothetical protein N8I77_001165 [Diaporthe amygdali]|uniref:Sulphur transport domain-containing protein n=1 Tax=Phomopsis amygdali TaxID=1214568 RepID=A0AAD9W7V6_PHOAM|nr:hypothetical protein N8I77_001165 [Diaporthe amygdali]
MDTVVSGMAFGAALVASGMYSPYLIASQFTLENWNMVQTFLTATGCSALSLQLLYGLGSHVPPPRSYSSLGLLGFSLDGNIIGGAVLGAGMSLAASCPGMVFPQAAMGVPSAPITLAGASVGGVFWSAVLRPWLAARQQRRAANGEGMSGRQPPKTLAQLFGTGRAATFVFYEVLLGALVATAASKARSAPSALHPVAGGLAVGAAQLLSLVLRGSLLGVSTCYEHFGDWIVYVLGGGRGPRPATASLLFPASMAAGALLLARQRPDLTAAAAAMTVHIAPWKAFWGGFLMAVGSRLGGGCTSGHGISGMGLMSVSSFVSMIATFAAAIAVSKL